MEEKWQSGTSSRASSDADTEPLQHDLTLEHSSIEDFLHVFRSKRAQDDVSSVSSSNSAPKTPLSAQQAIDEDKPLDDLREHLQLLEPLQLDHGVVDQVALDPPCSLQASSKLLVLGATSGHVSVYSLDGLDVLRTLPCHHAEVLDVGFSRAGTILSCSSDASIVILDPFDHANRRVHKFSDFGVVSVDAAPDFEEKRRFAFVSADNAVFSARFKFFWGPSALLQLSPPQNERIKIIRWGGIVGKLYLAWASSTTCWIFDYSPKRILFVLHRPDPIENLPSDVGSDAPVSIVWETQTNLVVCWGDAVQSLEISETCEGDKTVKIRTTFQLAKFWVCGLAILEQSAYVLCVVHKHAHAKKKWKSCSLLVVNRQGGIISGLDLNIKGKKFGRVLLESLTLASSSQSLNDGCFIYLACPEKIFAFKLRNPDVIVSECIASGRVYEALECADACRDLLNLNNVQLVANLYMKQLLEQHEEIEAVAVCQKYCVANLQVWMDRVLMFDAFGALHVKMHAFFMSQLSQHIALLVPTSNPKLETDTYNFILKRLVQTKSYV
jgi:hypothetical protein